MSGSIGSRGGGLYGTGALYGFMPPERSRLLPGVGSGFRAFFQKREGFRVRPLSPKGTCYKLAIALPLAS
jgi:hypothetical protein